MFDVDGRHLREFSRMCFFLYGLEKAVMAHSVRGKMADSGTSNNYYNQKEYRSVTFGKFLVNM